MASLIREIVFGAYGSLLTLYQRRSRTALAFTLIIPVILGLAPRAYRDYKTYLSYGPGGTPYNAFGWLAVSLLYLTSASETLSVDLYSGNEDQRSWLATDVLNNRGDRPVIGPHVVPQRQMSQVPEEGIKKKLVAAFEDLCLKNPDIIKLSKSGLERHTDALFVADGVAPTTVATQLKGEISHVHGTSDHSVHVTLSPADCKKVIEAGWGQRHPLDGSKLLKAVAGVYLSKQYLLIYAPRNEKEIETLMSIVKASILYVSGIDKLKESRV